MAKIENANTLPSAVNYNLCKPGEAILNRVGTINFQPININIIEKEQKY